MNNLLKLVTAVSLFFTATTFAAPNTEEVSIFKKQHEVLNDGIEYLTYSADIDDGRFVIIIDENKEAKQAVTRYIVGKKVYRLLAVNYCVAETDLCGDITTFLKPLEVLADNLYGAEAAKELVWRITYVKNDEIVSTDRLVPIPELGDLKDFVGVYSDYEDENDMSVSYDENSNTEQYMPHMLGWGYGPKVNP
ncbi:hypothetical protein [Gilliamella sp. Gris1-4]|uniref:hypothetical protein n=1 Tax=Gilliamella sp. Gris1-4 TaxID=3120244 RepID=UPI00080DB10D|nr:hypothetical protein [Gilliamella apicola]OCG33854.1 hypothetical protein A9G31_11280 [Gilliamella apicola]OCG68624.1 hypothetical protein A9G39_00070 [Gilliamella apicola]